MNRTKLPITSILVEDRQRREYGDIDDLAKSIKQFGLIQPIVINQNNRLIAGGRRYAACQKLGLAEVDVVYKETLTIDEAFEMELEENVRRLEMTWQERCLNIAKIHSLKRLRAAEDGKPWGMAETGELLGASKTNVHYCITIARELQRDPKSPLWAEPTMKAAWDLILRHEQEALLEEQRKRREAEAVSAPTVTIPALDVYLQVDDLPDPAAVDVAKESMRERYLSNPFNDPNAFDEYYAESVKKNATAPTVNLSGRLFHCSCLDFMAERPALFDHIITDIPYGIDIDMLEQQNPHSGMVDIDTIRQEHQVQGNLDLMRKFFPAAFATLKENGFLVTWCDLTGDPDEMKELTGESTMWGFMVRLALQAGFKVQRWPLVWNKTHRCMNQCAQYNFTKSIETALVCRKGNAVLMKTADGCVVTASNSDIRREIDHPFAKPFECWDFIAKHISFEGQVILEPFAGRGSGVISLLQLHRNVIGVELNDHHYNALVENVKRHYLKINPTFKFT